MKTKTFWHTDREYHVQKTKTRILCRRMVPVRIITFLGLLFAQMLKTCVKPAQEASVVGLLTFTVLEGNCSIAWLWINVTDLSIMVSDTFQVRALARFYLTWEAPSSTVFSLWCASLQCPPQGAQCWGTEANMSQAADTWWQMGDSSRKNKTMVFFVVLLQAFLKLHWENGLELTSLYLVLVEMERLYGWVFSWSRIWLDAS